MRVLLCSHDLSSNALGRSYVLWLCARELGWSAKIVGPAPTGRLWRPFRDTDFAADCRVTPTGGPLTDLAADADLIVAVKPLPESLGTARRIAATTQLPLVVDIDDPDLENLSRRFRIPMRYRDVFRHNLEVRAIHRLVPRLARTVSNPVLYDRYGGTFLPHVRNDMPFGETHESKRPTIAFVGTPRHHKGVSLLRHAISELAVDGFRLVVTADPPADAELHETWLGMTSFEEGLELTSSCDIVAVPALPRRFSIGQFPVKLVDAMLAGRAIIVSSVEPLPWVVGDGGVVIEPGSVDALVDALRSFTDPARRAEFGHRARERALASFTPEVSASALARAARMAWPPRRGEWLLP